MKNSSSNSKKDKSIANEIEIAKKEEKQLSEINLSKFADKLKNVELKAKREKETIYKYPESWNKEKINSEDGKKYRNKIRNQLKSFSNNIFYYAKTEDKQKLISEIEKFELFYANNYRINNYSISSITNSEKREKDIELMIEIIKSVKGK